MTDATGVITLAQSYGPYGSVTYASGVSQSAYGYTNEYTDSYIKLIYLRSRWYNPSTGRFPTKDSWQGDYDRPLSINRWLYVEGNPINLTDPSGSIPCPNKYWDNNCTIEDYYTWYFGPLLSLFGAPQNLSNLSINIGAREVSFPGAVTKEYMESVYYYGVVMNNIGDIGLSVMPGGGYVYDLYNASVGQNPFSGYVYSPSERYLSLAFIGLG